MSGIRARTLDPRTVTDAERDKWLDLSRRALEPNPFLDPRFLLASQPLWEGLDDIRLVVVEDAGRWLAVTALSARGRYPKTPMRYATTAGPYLGRRAALCTPLVDAERPQQAIAATIDHLSSSRSGLPGLIELTLIPADGPVMALLREHCDLADIPLQERSRFARAYAATSSPLHAPEHMSAARRKRMRRLRGELERTVGPVTLVDHGSSMAHLERLLDLEAAGWRGRRGSALRMKPVDCACFLAYMGQLAESAEFRVMTVGSAEHTVYTSLVVVIQGQAFGILDAYDETYAALSPGVLGRVLEQQSLMADPGIRSLDPCMHPRYADSTALYPDRREMVSVVIGAGAASRLLLRGRPAARALLRGWAPPPQTAS